jgi:predicted small metal-binding protein
MGSIYITKLPRWKAEILRRSYSHINDVHWMELLSDKNKSITCVSDGADDNRSAYGWIISDGENTWATGSGSVPGHPVSAFRAECFGKLAWLVYINERCQHQRQLLLCNIESFCDNMSIVRRTNIHHMHAELSQTLVPSFDIIKEIQIQQTRIKLRQSTRHVKAHQDRYVEPADLTLAERLNCMADKLATEDLDLQIKAGKNIQQCSLPNGGPCLSIDGKEIWDNETKLLKWRRAEFEIQDYCTKRFKITLRNVHAINWAGIHLARKTLTPGILMFSLKYGIDWLPTGKQMHRCGNLVTECTWCGGIEDGEHLLLCPNRTHLLSQAIQ